MSQRSNANVTETTYEVRFHLFLVMQTSLLLSIIYYFFTRGGERGRLDSHSQLLTIGVFFTAFIAYFMLKISSMVLLIGCSLVGR